MLLSNKKTSSIGVTRRFVDSNTKIPKTAVVIVTREKTQTQLIDNYSAFRDIKYW